jgi:hypothetical protein
MTAPTKGAERLALLERAKSIYHEACVMPAHVTVEVIADHLAAEIAAARREGRELRALDRDTIARVLHEAHKPWCDYTYSFEHPMSSREVYEALADAVIAAQDAAVRERGGEE